MADKFLNNTGLSYYHNRIKALFATQSALSTVDGKIIETIKVNSTALVPDQNKAVDITVPTKVSDLTNDSGFQTSSQVESAINAKIASSYKAKGSCTFANLPSLIADNEGNVYNVTDSFTTTSDFVEGAGSTYPAGTNVVIINTTGTTYKYDVLSGMVDFSAYWTSTTGQTNTLVAITTAEIDALFE